MTPTESEKQAALAWADRVVPEAEFAMYGGPLVSVLAAALRQAEESLGVWCKQVKIELRIQNEQRQRAEKAESRLKTLEEENARMREALKGISRIADKVDGGDWDEITEARRIARAALRQEAE